ncbi:MAG: PDZ domain-containing protein [Myxococcota bacterium]|nr:PDZ domain-containing protein [Myxococcota bacterium]
MTPGMRGLAFFAAGAIVVGLAWWIRGDEGRPVSVTEEVREAPLAEDTEALGREVEKLRVQLWAEAKARAALEVDLARLREELVASGRLGAGEESVDPRSSFHEGPPLQTGSVTGGERDAPGRPPGEISPDPSEDDSERPMFDVGRLVAAGIHPQDAEELLGAWEQFSLDRLYLVDQAAREGWLYKPRFQREVAGLEHAMLEDVGEDGWDRLLYGSGQPNRVVVRQVLEGSSADLAGLQPGDVIMRYNDRRVFKTEWLQAATARGRPGAVVRLEVFRGGEPITVDVERGPLGTLLRNAHVPPPVP